ncbi:hypothetical protein HN261_21805 [Acinetobacter baumannii]|nr:hypothetical protein [Acinetobacter baumannii]
MPRQLLFRHITKVEIPRLIHANPLPTNRHDSWIALDLNGVGVPERVSPNKAWATLNV